MAMMMMMMTMMMTTTMYLMFLLLLQVNAGWVDPDTKQDVYKMSALTAGDDRKYQIVFSDEFEQEGRTFQDGEDPRWTAIEKNDYTNDALHYYSPDNVRTTNGMLNITTNFKENTFMAFNEKTKKHFPKTKHLQSAMLQGWNKFCFTGGIVEIRAKLPGKPETGGLWPALWLLGNLARATYVGSSDFMWPWSYDVCDSSKRLSQKINACSEVNHFGLFANEGRGAPEIDVLEAMGGPPGKLPNTHVQRPYFSASLQVAPGLMKDRPEVGHIPREGHWYEGLAYGNVTKAELNPFFYGVTLEHKPKAYTYQSDALSANMPINASHFNSHHIYRVEWEPSNRDGGGGGYIRWFCDGELVYGIEADALNITGAHIPNEPMYVLLNTAVSSSWGFPKPCPYGCDCACYECGNPDCMCGLPDGFCEDDNIPSSFEIDYVRVYQAVNDTNHEAGCSTDRRPTKWFIEGHRDLYMNKNDKAPLLAVPRGGALCYNNNNDDDDDGDGSSGSSSSSSSSSSCGGPKKGTCLSNNQCECKDGFTGPRCLSHDGFDDSHQSEKEPFRVNTIEMPVSLASMLALMILGLCSATLLNVRTKRNQASRLSYKQIPSSSYNSNNNNNNNTAALYEGSTYEEPYYQKSNVMDNANTSNNVHDTKVVTYCMIDDRLVDQ